MIYNYYGYPFNDKIFTLQDYEYFLSIINISTKYKDIKSPYANNILISDFNNLIDSSKNYYNELLNDVLNEITSNANNQQYSVDSLSTTASKYSKKALMPKYIKLVTKKNSTGNISYYMLNDNSISFKATDKIYDKLKVYGYLVNSNGAVLTFGETIPIVGGSI